MTASSYRLKDLFGTTRSSSIPNTRPYPSHLGHAPIGELKLNIFTEGTWKLIPSASKRFEKERCTPSISIKHSPFPSYKAVSIDSDIRETVSFSRLTEIRSTTRKHFSWSGKGWASCITSSIRRNPSPYFNLTNPWLNRRESPSGSSSLSGFARITAFFPSCSST